MKKALLYLGGFGLLGGALYMYFKKQANLLLQYKVDIVGVKFGKVTANSVDMVISVKFTSIADLEARVNKMYLDVAVEGANVGYVTNDKTFIIPAKGFSYIDLNITFNPKLILGNVVDIVIGVKKNKDINVDLNGFANVSSGILSTTIPIKYHTTIKEYFGIK
jgi:LEA14-like dessication related protein